MENLAGVEKYLNEGCFIIGQVIKNGFDRIFFTAVYKEYKKQTKIISHSGGNILSALNKISLKKWNQMLVYIKSFKLVQKKV